MFWSAGVCSRFWNQAITNCRFSKSFPLIFMQIGGGGGDSLLSDQPQVGTKETIRFNYKPAFSTFNFELSTCSTTAISASPASVGQAFLPVHHTQDRHRNVTGPSIGCTIGAPVRRDSIKLAFSAKYHFAARSASSISINRGLCFKPSACWIMVFWSCRRKILPKIRKIQTGRKNKFHAATKSMRQRSRCTGVTVARLENHIFPL